MDNNTVAIAALGIVGTAVASLVWIVKFLMREIKTSLDKNTESHYRVAEVSEETLTFLKNLNGRLTKITAQKIKENE